MKTAIDGSHGSRFDAVPVSSHRSECGEGPLWDRDNGCLLYCDLTAGEVLSLDVGSGELMLLRSFRGYASSLIPTPDDVLVTVGNAFRSVRTGEPVLRADHLDPRRGHLNDSCVDSTGAILVGWTTYGLFPGEGRILRMHANGSIEELERGLTLPNGIAVSSDRQRLCVVESLPGGVRSYSMPQVSATSLGPVIGELHFEERQGTPDGVAVDDQGGLWIAMYGAGVVRRHAADGSLTAIVHVDAPHVTSCCFGGEDNGTLFITTATLDLDADGRRRHPHAGAVFACATGFRGMG